MIDTLLLAAAITFRGYVPPHAAADGVRFQVVADAAVDLPSAMRACGIDDFARLRRSGTDAAYQFAVARGATGGAQCLKARLPSGAQLAPLGNWITDAQAD